MNIKDMPMNEPIKFSEHEHTSVMITRVEDEKMIARYVNKSNGDVVAQLNLWDNGDSEVISIDPIYWSCTINGSPATSEDLSDLLGKSLNSTTIELEDRKIHFSI